MHPHSNPYRSVLRRGERVIVHTKLMGGALEFRGYKDPQFPRLPLLQGESSPIVLVYSRDLLRELCRTQCQCGTKLKYVLLERHARYGEELLHYLKSMTSWTLYTGPCQDHMLAALQRCTTRWWPLHVIGTTWIGRLQPSISPEMS